MANTYGFGGDNNAFNKAMFDAIAEIEGADGAQSLIDNEISNGDSIELPEDVVDIINNAGTLEDYK